VTEFGSTVEIRVDPALVKILIPNLATFNAEH